MAAKENSRKRRVVLIGIDAATFRLIMPWAERGKLPFFRKLLSESAHGELLSTIPPVTIPAWPSMFSGLRPDSLGFAGFVNKIPGKNEFDIFSSRKWAEKSIIELLSRKRKKIISINLPGTSPPWKINGIMVSGMLGSEKKPCYPPEFKKELSGYVIEGHGYKEARRAFNARMGLLRKLAEKDFDLLVFVIRYPDSISHKSVKDWRKYFYPCYKEVDSALAEVFEYLRDDYVIIASDHGTQRTAKNFYLNSWLEKKGYLNVINENALKRIRKRALQYGKIMLDVLGMQSVKEIAGKLVKENISEKADLKGNIFFEQSIAYSRGEGGTSNFGCIFINREKAGNDYEKVRDEIISQLKKEPEIEMVWKKEDIHKKNIENFSDIIFRAKDGVAVLNDLDFPLVKLKSSNLIHDEKGIFIIKGRDITEGSIEQAKIWDIAPTILHILDVPCPEMDGRVLKEVFKKDSFFYKKRPRKAVKITIETEKDKIKDVVGDISI